MNGQRLTHHPDGRIPIQWNSPQKKQWFYKGVTIKTKIRNIKTLYFLLFNFSLKSKVLIKVCNKDVPVHAMQAYMGSKGTAPCILKLSTRWKQVVSFIPQPPKLWKQTSYPSNRRLGGPQSWSGHFGEGKDLLPARIQTHYHPACNLVILNMLTWFPFQWQYQPVLLNEKASFISINKVYFSAKNILYSAVT